VSRKNRRSHKQNERRRAPIPCTKHLIVAPLWVAFEANLGTLLRSCDAVGACMAVPDTDHYRRALKVGDTLPSRPCLHWVNTKLGWIDRQRSEGAQIIGVELDEDSISLVQLRQSRRRTIVLLGHEHSGLPQEVWPFLDQVVEIPMVGVGSSLNVAVAGSLVLYKLAGLS
jgi:tRNA (guanosine-2'-O-)-methyltransferase